MGPAWRDRRPQCCDYVPDQDARGRGAALTALFNTNGKAQAWFHRPTKLTICQSRPEFRC